MKYLSPGKLLQEFDRQSENLLKLDYPERAAISPGEFQNILLPLRRVAENLHVTEHDFEKGYLPFVIVMKSELISAEQMMELASNNGKHGVTILRPHTSSNFKTINEVGIPTGRAYIIADIDRGKETLNVRPKDAMPAILKAERSPLTIDEGIALITQFPEFLRKNNCFSLLASRTGSDKRVPAIWINSKKEPNLGWCWDGNPHTWLGSASAKYRFGAE